jgi:anaerobic selenocysteine-containing dehydrogenase/Fe-S-cluster-containing dehydrogenase component
MSQKPESGGVKRRDFLKILGASGATVAAAGCAPEPSGKLIPYLVSPDQTVPGVSNYYATVCRECSVACGIIAETRDGRAIKLEGNPAHPASRGALCARGQSALQGLYNPDRFRSPMVRQGTGWQPITWEDAIRLVTQRLGEARGRGGYFVNQHESGSFPAFLDAWLADFGLPPHLSIDFEADAAAIEAHRQAYGVAWPRFMFQEARLIVSFGADFLDGWGASVPQQLDFAEARARIENAPRFVYVGARRSLTGLNADQWIPCRAGSELAIINFLRGQGSAEQAAAASDVPATTLVQLLGELQRAGRSLVLAAGTTAQGHDVVAGAAALNQSLGNVGTAIRPAEGYASLEGITRFDALVAAVDQMRQGSVPIVFVRGTNPAYYLPASFNFAEAFSKVPFKVSFSCYPDETSELCDLILPDLHSLESWGDAPLQQGTVALQQPTMDPVFAGTRGTADVLLDIARGEAALAPRYAAATDYRTWLLSRFPGGERAFAAALPQGMGPGAIAPRTSPAMTPPTVRQLAPLDQQQGDFFFVTYPSPVLGDGRGANKPWLQELPDPVTKVLWSSWVEIHPETAARLGIRRGDIVEVTTSAGSVRAPAFLYLGVRPDTVAMALGQGHRSPSLDKWFEWKDEEIQWGYGRYARNIGAHAFDAATMATNPAGGFVWSGLKATLSKSGGKEELVSTEGSARQHGRGIAQAIVATDLGTLRVASGGEHGAAPPGGEEDGNYDKGHQIPGMAKTEHLPGLRSPVAADAQGELGSPSRDHQGKLKGMYNPGHSTGMAGRRWAMTIDLARCTGCSACVTACYAENNIPTVGAPWQNATVFAVAKPGFNITRGREMNWIRLERYFEGADEGQFTPDFEARMVPMLCQHCGNAPCEPVCPVYATYQAPDGLNVQVYNRCVGTRYCSNNCPYKVRYFNWFGYGEANRKQYAFPEPLNWQLNPDVTVRAKGVMEKCSFCVQRIREAENRANAEGRDLVADEFTTACAAACPSRAIVFGDAADPNWSVARLAQDRRAYHVFEELNTFTAVVYLKKVNHSSPGADLGGAVPPALPTSPTPAPAPAGAGQN